MRIVGTFEDRAEWLAARRNGIGASDIYALMGTAPRTWGLGAHSVWRSKVMELEDRDDEHLMMGHIFEPVILAEFARRTGLYVNHIGAANTIIGHDDLPWAIASPDGLVFESPDTEGLADCLGPVQAKRSTNSHEWDEVPAHYSDQVMWECFVTGREMGWIAVEHRQSIGIYEAKLDLGRVTEMVERAQWLWESHVVPEIDPPLTADDDPDDAYPDADPEKAVEVGWDIVERLARAKQNENAAHENRKALERQLKEQLKEATVGLVDGDEVVTWREVDRKGYTVQPTTFRQLRLLVTAEEASTDDNDY